MKGHFIICNYDKTVVFFSVCRPTHFSHLRAV